MSDLTTDEADGSLALRMVGKFSAWNRGRKVEVLQGLIERLGVRSVLMVGVSAGSFDWENIVERGIEESAEFVVASGLATGCRDQWERYVVCDGLRLPFPDKSFDLVVSNAVIEHVGQRAQQVRFAEEHARVGLNWVLTTPNRWFPVESHTRALLLHWFGSWRRNQTAFTRLLSARELLDTVPSGAEGRGWLGSPTLMAASPGCFSDLPPPHEPV